MKKLFAFMVSIALSLTAIFACACTPTAPGSVAFKYYNLAGDMLPVLMRGDLSVGLLPEPAASKLESLSSNKTWYRLNVQELYDSQEKAYPQAVMLVNNKLLKSFPQLASKMANAFSGNVEWVKNNPALAVDAVNANLVETTASLTASSINANVVDGCNIYWQSATDAKTQIANYLNDIKNIVSTSAKEIADEYFYSDNIDSMVEEFTSNTVKVAVPDGAPALAIAKFINDGEDFETGLTFDYDVVSAQVIGSKVTGGVADVVILPVNAASLVSQIGNGSNYKLVSVVTHGNLFIMSSTPITSVSELANKTVGVIGQGNVPDLTFKAVLNKNNLKFGIAI